MVGGAALDAHAGLVGGDDLGPPQRRNGGLATRTEARLRAAEQVHQPALAEAEPEQVGQRRLQPLIRERLKGLEIRRHRVQPRPERRALRFLRHRRDNPRPAIRALHGEPPVLRPDRRHRGQLDPLRDADDLSWKIPMQEAATARTVVGTMLGNSIRIVAEHPAVTLVTRLGTAGLRLRALRLAVGRGRLRGRARSLIRTL
jgi:hypothetical protein